MNVSQYPDFVKARFKTFPTRIETLLHATVGLAGEACEWAGAVTTDEQIEELGDMEFYIEAAFQVLEASSELLEHEPSGSFMPGPFIERCGIPLDIVKKSWVYNKPFNDVLLIVALRRVRNDLLELYHRRDWRREAILFGNMEKLRKRFPDGYSDADAQARADKPQESEND